MTMLIKSYRKQNGLTLIELMISLVMSLVLTAAAINLFVSSKETYKTDAEFAKLQDSGRYAIDALQRDIRMAGYAGCKNLNNVDPNIIANDPPAFAGISDSVRGWESGAGWTNPTTVSLVPGTDVVRVNRASRIGANLTGNMDAENANIQVDKRPDGLEAGDLVFITDCQVADLFRATTVSTSASTIITITHANSTNTSNRLSKAYQANAQVMTVDSSTYFVGQNAAGEPSLYLLPVDTTVPVELIEGVQDMQLIYEVDTTGNKVPDAFVDASAVTDWGDVLGVRVGLLLRTADGTAVSPQSITFNGTDANPGGDGRLRKAFWSSVAIRNQLP